MDATSIADLAVERLFRLVIEHHRRHVSDVELTVTQAQGLRLLWAEALTANGLSRALGISAPAVSQLTDRLCSKGLIDRRTSKSDRRSVIIELTGKGRRLVEDMRKRRKELFSDLLSRLESDDQQRVIEALQLLTADLLPDSAREAGDEQAARPSEERTAIGRVEASNESRAESGPARRRMRIEWD